MGVMDPHGFHGASRGLCHSRRARYFWQSWCLPPGPGVEVVQRRGVPRIQRQRAVVLLRGGVRREELRAVADEADLNVSDASGAEDTAIPLTISSELTDTDSPDANANMFAADTLTEPAPTPRPK